MTHLTEKEYFNAKENVKQIENYIKQEILPYINGTLEIPFGQETNRFGKKHLILYVGNNYGNQSIVGYSGHLEISFDENYEPYECGRGVCIYNSQGYGGNFCYELIKDWQIIKNKLLDFKMTQQKKLCEIKSTLLNFAL